MITFYDFSALRPRAKINIFFNQETIEQLARSAKVVPYFKENNKLMGIDPTTAIEVGKLLSREIETLKEEKEKLEKEREEMY